MGLKQKATIRIVRVSDGRDFVIDGTTWAITNQGLDNFGSFNNDVKIVQNAVSDGGVVSSIHVGTIDRMIEAAGLYRELNPILRRQVTSFFNAKDRYKVYVTYMGTTTWCEGYVYKFAMDTANVDALVRFKVMFRCEKPYLNSFDDFGKDISFVRGAGFPYLCTKRSKAPTGIFNFAKSVNIANRGDVETFCRVVFIASGDVINPVIYMNDGSYVRVLDIMHDKDVIEMDFVADPPTVRKNGKNCLGLCDRTSDFSSMVLSVGDNNISYDADDGSNLLAVMVYYNELYASI